MFRSVRVSVAVAALASVFLIGAGAAQAAINAKGSVEQVYATGLVPGAKVKLVDARGKRVAAQKVSALGGILFRDVKPGGGYTLRSRTDTSAPVTVLSTQPAPPSTDVYDQDIPSSGYGYLTTRDGTKLSIYVHPPQDVSTALPGGVKIPSPPGTKVPTLIEYAGYGYADPKGPQSGIAVIANLMGFAVVDVNMRGTGCSGGAFDFFEPLQGLDGYDVIETIARQPWVANGKVGMMGISYGGISQLFTAENNPPSLAAISPLSVIDNTQTTLYPGGILNTGFALEWAKERIHDALPASPDGGQKWAYEQDPVGRPDVQGQPGPAPRGGQPAGQDQGQQQLCPGGRRPALAGHLRQQDQGAGVHGVPVDRRADGRPLPDARRRSSPAASASGSRSPTAPTSTRSTPRR